jgi:hypothetical protein
LGRFFFAPTFYHLPYFYKKNNMKLFNTIACLLLSFNGWCQNVAINSTASAPDPSAMLDVSSNNKGLLVPRMTQAQRLAIASPANGLLVYQTDGQSGFYYNFGTALAPSWVASGAANNTWATLGNSLLATGTLGTTSNNHIDLMTNNIVRGRLTNLGEFFIGTTNTAIAGDLMSAVSNTTFPFAVNGYSSSNGAGVYGAIQAGNTQVAGVQGEYQSTTAGIFNTAGVRGSNQSNVAGTGFRTQAAAGPRAGVIGNNTATNGQYTFGIHGSMGSTDIRCGGIIGDDFGIALGSLGYFSASLADYSVYGFGFAYQVGAAGGRGSYAPEAPNTQIGLGIYGGVMGGWMRGLVYGTHIKGERYSLYVDGKTYTNEPVAELIANADGSRTPAYSLATAQPEVYARGKALLQNGRQYIAFTQLFSSMAVAEDIVVTVSPLGNSKGLYIAGQDAKGFWVNENEGGTGSVGFSWMAIAARKGFDKTTTAPELLQADFDRKMNNVMYNDNNKTGTPQPIWWDGTTVRFDAPPARQADASYQPGTRQIPAAKL